jgi:transposase
MTRSPLKPQQPASSVSPLGIEETPEQRIARLEGRVRELEAETTKLTTEREILRSAAKYFAGETNW